MPPPREALGDDVPAVLRLGRLVRDDRHLARRDAAVLRRADRPRVRHHRAGGDDLAVLRRHGRRPVLRHRADAGGPAPGRRGWRSSSASHADRVRRRSTPCSSPTRSATCRPWRSATRCRSTTWRPRPRVPGRARARHDRLDRRRPDHRHARPRGHRGAAADGRRRRRSLLGAVLACRCRTRRRASSGTGRRSATCSAWTR